MDGYWRDAGHHRPHGVAKGECLSHKGESHGPGWKTGSRDAMERY